MSETNQPQKTYKMNDLEVALWQNVINKSNGNGAFTKKTVSIKRNYKDKNDEWKTSNYIPLQSIPALKELLTKVVQQEAVTEK